MAGRMRLRFSIGLLAAGMLALTGCRDGQEAAPPPPAASADAATTGPAPGAAASDVDGVEPFVMKGVASTVTGEPIAGATVYARNTLVAYSNLRTVTDAAGRYRIELPRQDVTTWQAGGNVQRTYHGAHYDLILRNAGPPFGSGDGAVRNLVLELTGVSDPKYDIRVGEMVRLEADVPGGYWNATIELTMVPDGPLIDGSTGQTLVKTVADGHVNDVPIGRYAFTARWISDAGPVDLLLRVSHQGNWQPSVTAVIPDRSKDTLSLQAITPEAAADGT
ncbi:MAG: hypothetical protein Q4F49_02985 [Pseudoxanthomonas suwonensis]|nr:hypothetical protein [Pseudoxanthomonas suwonensis]